MKTSLTTAVLSILALSLPATNALAFGCGAAGLPPCEVPEPGSLPMIIGAVVIAAVVARARRK